MRDVVINLDLGSNAGWAVFSLGDELLESGSWSVGKRSGAHPGERWSSLRFELLMLLDRYRGRVSAIAFERPIIYGGKRSYTAARVIFAQAAIVESVAFEHVVEVIEIQPSVAKKLLTGNGHATKEEMIEAAVARWGPLEREDDGREDTVKARGDEADARAIGHYVLGAYCLEGLAAGEVLELMPKKKRERRKSKA